MGVGAGTMTAGTVSDPTLVGKGSVLSAPETFAVGAFPAGISAWLGVFCTITPTLEGVSEGDKGT